jgi:hypothetical protein
MLYKTHEHEGMKHESLKVSSFGIAAIAAREKSKVPFSKISKEHLRKVVRGRDGALFEAFFQDALSRRLGEGLRERPDPDGRSVSPGASQQQGVDVPGAVINKQWRLRDSTDRDEDAVPVGLHLSSRGREFCRVAHSSAGGDPRDLSAAVAMKAHAVDVDLSPEELRRQAMVLSFECDAALRAMQRQAVPS